MMARNVNRDEDVPFAAGCLRKEDHELGHNVDRGQYDTNIRKLDAIAKKICSTIESSSQVSFNFENLGSHHLSKARLVTANSRYTQFVECFAKSNFHIDVLPACIEETCG